MFYHRQCSKVFSKRQNLSKKNGSGFLFCTNFAIRKCRLANDDSARHDDVRGNGDLSQNSSLVEEWICRKFWCNILLFRSYERTWMGFSIKAAKIFQWVCLDESLPIWYGDLYDKWDKRRISQLLMHHYTKLELLFYCNYIFMEDVILKCILNYIKYGQE